MKKAETLKSEKLKGGAEKEKLGPCGDAREYGEAAAGASRFWTVLACRWLLGAVFVYSGVVKWQNPTAFADSVATFQMLPPVAVSLIAICLPSLELVAGLLLVGGFRVRPAALTVLAMLCGFILVIVQGLARGLEMNCGCFGETGSVLSSGWMVLGRDVLLLMSACVLLGALQWKGNRVN